MYLAKDSYRTGEIENTSNLEIGTSYVNRTSATGFAGWLGNEQVEKRAVGGGRESCWDMQGGDCGSSVENVLCTQLPTPLERSRNPWVQILILPLTGKAGQAISRSLSYFLPVSHRNRSTSCCEREERKTRKTCDCIQGRVWHAASGNLVLEPVSHFGFCLHLPWVPNKRKSSKFPCRWLSCGKWRETPGRWLGRVILPFSIHWPWRPGLWDEVMCKKPRRLILSGRPPSLPHPSTRHGVPSPWNKGKPLTSRFLCPPDPSFSGFSWSSPSPHSSLRS